MKKKETSESDIKKALQEQVIHNLELHGKFTESEMRMYRFGFWFFFILIIFSVLFSVFAIASIYTNFQVVTNIMSESFDRTNMVLDVTSAKIMRCENSLKNCQTSSNPATAVSG